LEQLCSHHSFYFYGKYLGNIMHPRAYFLHFFTFWAVSWNKYAALSLSSLLFRLCAQFLGTNMQSRACLLSYVYLFV
jgi:hypothetical protein